MSNLPASHTQSGRLADLARQHPTLVLTAGYVVLTLVGLVYSAWLFLYFRINIIEYSETSDFLLAAVRAPLVILLAILPALIVFLIGKVVAWARRKFPRYDARYKRNERKWWSAEHLRGPIWIAFIIVYAILFTQLYAKRVASEIRAGNGRKVRIELANGAPQSADLPTLIGTTGSFVFLYYPEANETKIVPFNAVTSITVAGKRKKPVR
jgi:hypothetical protein